MVLPASTKYIGDEVFIKQQYGLLKWIALAIGIATLVQASTGFRSFADPRRCRPTGDHRDA